MNEYWKKEEHCMKHYQCCCYCRWIFFELEKIILFILGLSFFKLNNVCSDVDNRYYLLGYTEKISLEKDLGGRSGGRKYMVFPKYLMVAVLQSKQRWKSLSRGYTNCKYICGYILSSFLFFFFLFQLFSMSLIQLSFICLVFFSIFCPFKLQQDFFGE